MKLIFILIFFWTLSSFGDEKNLNEILDAIDKTYRSESSWALVEMEIQTEHWSRKLQLEMWTKGLDYTLIRIQSPKKDEGISTLKRKNEMWNYFPKINKVIKVPPSMMMGSWMGSDFTNDDLVKDNTFRSDYISKFLPSTNPEIYRIELVPKEKTVSVWSRIELEVEKKRMLLLKQLSYNDRGENVRTISFSKIKQMGGKLLPTELKLVPHKKKDQSTTVRYKEAKFNLQLPPNLFRRQGLQRKQ
ncbi:MAG: outer membrane lipoprotein-sorting protein [Bdellovibrionales bacterium]|nr:outer membrane lipoprotein-sorting protein [Bdellovibrionales bacterium]